MLRASISRATRLIDSVGIIHLARSRRLTCTSSYYAVSQQQLPRINHNSHNSGTTTIRISTTYQFQNNNVLFQKQLLMSMQQQQQAHSFATKSKSKSKIISNNNKQQPKKKQSNAVRKRKEKILVRNERQNKYREEQKRKIRMKNLHPAAKMKRVLSSCDYWFSDSNLKNNDPFFQDVLKDYQGWVRLSTLASFPKLDGWTDLQIIKDALDSEAGRKNYKVIFNRELVEIGTINRRLRRIRMAQETSNNGMKVDKGREKWRKRRIRELKRYVEKTRGEWYLPIWKQALAEEEQEIQEEMQQLELERRQHLKDRCSQFNSSQKFTHMVKTVLETVQEFVSNQTNPKKEDGINIDDMTVDDIDWNDYYYHEDYNYEDQLMEENDEFRQAVLEMEDLERERDDEWNNIQHNRWFEREFGREIERGTKREKMIERKDFENLGISLDLKNLQEQELPSVIHDDGSELLKYAVVRHRRVNLNYLAELSAASETVYDYDDELDDELDESVNDAPTPEETKKKPEKKRLQKYSSGRPVDVIRNSKELATFCRKLNQSLERSEFKAIGFDVECCSLEMDIRTTLPAMLQLASPERDGPVGLIWLDKFPNHGKDMIVDESFQDLTALLNDSSISKVGVGVYGDVKNLANWWGITDEGYADFFFSGMVDLVNELPDQLYSESTKRSLQEVCALVLERDLPKMKEKNAKRNKKRRKKGKRVKTSHWRRDDLTPEMKKYAADDASASIDVWLKLQESSNASDDGHEEAAVATGTY